MFYIGVSRRDCHRWQVHPDVVTGAGNQKGDDHLDGEAIFPQGAGAEVRARKVLTTVDTKISAGA